MGIACPTHKGLGWFLVSLLQFTLPPHEISTPHSEHDARTHTESSCQRGRWRSNTIVQAKSVRAPISPVLPVLIVSTGTLRTWLGQGDDYVLPGEVSSPLLGAGVGLNADDGEEGSRAGAGAGAGAGSDGGAGAGTGTAGGGTAAAGRGRGGLRGRGRGRGKLNMGSILAKTGAMVKSAKQFSGKVGEDGVVLAAPLFSSDVIVQKRGPGRTSTASFEDPTEEKVVEKGYVTVWTL